MLGSLKGSIMGFAPEIMNMCFFETPLIKNGGVINE